MKLIERLIGQTKPKIGINKFTALLHEYVNGNIDFQTLKFEADAIHDKIEDGELLRILQWVMNQAWTGAHARIDRLYWCLILGESGTYKNASSVETALAL